MQMLMLRVGALALGGLLAGCSTPIAKQAICTTAGALVGGAAAIAASDGDDSTIALSAVGGAVVGALLCKEPEPKPAPPKPAPAPKPAPKPAPPPPPPPDPDTDGDGVKDSVDACPGTAPGTPVDAKGCPEIPDLRGVHFEFDKAALTAEAKQVLDGGIATLGRNPHVVVEVTGHTDSMGDETYNQRLSERRADAVRKYFVANGVDPGRVTASGRGESSPVASNDTREGRQENRRVEIVARPR